MKKCEKESVAMKKTKVKREFILANAVIKGYFSLNDRYNNIPNISDEVDYFGHISYAFKLVLEIF